MDPAQELVMGQRAVAQLAGTALGSITDSLVSCGLPGGVGKAEREAERCGGLWAGVPG